jgi:ABC-type dipeptide/oligopeptide/nickel transport system permease component
MAGYVVRRLFFLVFIVFAVSISVFLMMHLVPGDPARIMAGLDATEDDILLMREKLGLDLPLHVQYARYMRGLLRGDLGTSIRTGRPVAQSLLSRYPATLELAGMSLLLAFMVALFAGVIAATHSNTFLDIMTMTGAIFGISMPSFWRGLMLMLLFSLILGWLPASGRGGTPFSWAGGIFQ